MNHIDSLKRFQSGEDLFLREPLRTQFGHLPDHTFTCRLGTMSIRRLPELLQHFRFNTSIADSGTVWMPFVSSIYVLRKDETQFEMLSQPEYVFEQFKYASLTTVDLISVTVVETENDIQAVNQLRAAIRNFEETEKRRLRHTPPVSDLIEHLIRINNKVPGV